VNGVVHTGKTTTVTISGTHFYGQPKITSNAKVDGSRGEGQRQVADPQGRDEVHDTKGIHTFIIRFANGEQTNVKYNDVK